MTRSHTHGDRWRIGVVPFLNTKPLIEGLNTDPRFELVPAVPSLLAETLDRGEVVAALVPVIDLARQAGHWRILSDACIGSEDETLTVRIFSRVAPEDIDTLYVDGDSHTSVALASILWQENHGRCLQIRRFDPRCPDECEAVLLIGDKVVVPGLRQFEQQIDLGAAWRTLTGLPFVFATWAADAAARLDELAAALSQARNRGVARAADLASEHGPARGWPADLAREYLTRHLSFTLTPAHRSGLRTFLELAAKWNLAPAAAEMVPA